MKSEFFTFGLTSPSIPGPSMCEENWWISIFLLDKIPISNRPD